jgi:Na+-transporting NADH:ubiquinone oxidoreductase subunit NqrD
LCGIFPIITCQHTLRDNDSIPWTKQPIAAHAGAWEMGKGKGDGYSLAVVVVAVVAAVIGVGFL